MKRIYKIAGVVCAAVAAILITAVIFFIRKTNNISIVFYGLDENTVQVIQEQITAFNLQTEKPLVFEVTDSSSALNAGKIKNSTLLFTVNGKAVQEVQDKALMFNDAVYESVPTSLRDSLKKRVPVLLDHYEASFYTTLLKRESLTVPKNYSELFELLSSEKECIEYPSVCAGKNDDELFGFVSNIALCLLGNDGYDSLCKTTAEAGEENISPDLKTVLDEIRLWQNKGLIVKNWYDSNCQDITDFFVPERNAGTIFMSLSLHRKIQSMYLKYFETLPFPRKDAAFSSGIVAPEICALSFSNADIAETIIRQLLSEEVQAQLSDRTKLAPCTRNAVAHDRQSDDVRYWAASSNKGALVQIGLASFSDPVQRKTFAKTIRSYLRQ